MLILRRQQDESITIGNNVKVTVIDIRGESVRLGVEAPPHVSIHREEVFQAMNRSEIKELNNGNSD